MSASTSPEDKDQKSFDNGIKCVNLLVNPDNLYKLANGKVSQLHLHQSLPSTINLTKLLNNLTNLKVLDLSHNNMGPQAFRAVCLAMSNNMTIISLNLSDNRADTDSAACIGMMLKENKTLQYLDVSGNNLGKDYFSRCVGPALKTNSSLLTLRAESIGSVDMKLLLESLQENNSLEDFNISNNQITDRTCIGKYLAVCLQQKSSTKLYSINISNCNMNPDGIKLLLQGLQGNITLTHLNMSGNEFGSLQTFYEVILCCFQLKTLSYLSITDARLSDITLQRKDIQTSTVSALEILKLNSSKLTNELFSLLAQQLSGKLTNLTELDIGNNPDLKVTCLLDIYKLTSGDSKKSSIKRLSYGLNDIEDIANNLKTNWTQLNYLNLRKCKVSMAGLTCLSVLVQNKELPITTLVLDGLKLSGTPAFNDFCSALPSSHITAISFDGCQLADEDLVPFCQAMGKGLKLHMLKLSANRLTDEFTSTFVKNLLQVSNYPLAVLDLSNNQLNNKTPSEIVRLYSTKGYKTLLHSINLQSNNIGSEGIITIVSCITPTSILNTLYIDKQRTSFEESQVNDIGMKIATKLGYKVNIKDNTIETGCSPLPNILQSGIHINISSLGGHTGEIIYKLDCPAIVTDLSSRQLLYLTFSQVMEIASHLKGYKDGECILSNVEFNMITGSNKDREVPSWLQLSDKRDVGLYLSNLPGNATVNKLEAIFEMEADCNVDEICLMKDPVSRNNSGIGWVLMSDAKSVEKAIQFFQQGEAKIFGQPFLISRIQVKLHDSASLEAEQKARKDMEERLKQRKIDEAAHRQLILHNTEESWKRHAYRLAHPAYADGRIW
ncbi:hypothetical protein LOTGIDRAFT_171908 [Lottia gigantea]|uniref:RRM domain-containing protein n=1 Tax=Lottia gigantea TaxID=225164 RepID=V4AYC6_LOTGI|nr:hypothetical protein LOTGIDRAFT_171908 [Lottia gigantea]ESP02588.1 hypothetical protein LOTGIDRAFT_171908 [Lottia gigantea]